MTYKAEDAEIKLLALLNDQRTPEMYALAQEFLRTKQIPRTDGRSDDPRVIANALLAYKRFPQQGLPEEIDVQLALEAYQVAPAPTNEELESRYQRLMARVKAPNRLADLRRDGPSDPVGYQRLASTLTRALKYLTDAPDPAPYSDDEVHAIARVFEQFTNMRETGNPWQAAEVNHKKYHAEVYRDPKDTELSFAERVYYEAANRIGRLYMGSGVRHHVDADRVYRTKPEYAAEFHVFKLNPNYTDSEISELAKEMFAPHKVTIADAESRIGPLADAMCQYRDAFDQLQRAKRDGLPSSGADTHHAMLTAADAYRRRLSSMMNTLKVAGFSHAAASSALFSISMRLFVTADLNHEFDTAVQTAARKHGEPMPKLDATTVSEWLADVEELRPYLTTRALMYPALEQTLDGGAPYPQVSAETIAHLAQVGYAPPNPAPYID